MHNACESTSWPVAAVCDQINMFKQKTNELLAEMYLSIGGADRGGVPFQDGDR